MSRGSYNRTAIFVVTAPPDFRPQRAWTLPDTFTSATLHMKNLSVHQARQFVRLFNARQVQLLERGEWDHLWMIVSSCVRPSKWTLNAQPAGEKRGAA